MDAVVIRARSAEIRRTLEQRILAGDWPPGHRVPSELSLTTQYGCSRMTVNKALSALAAAGLIVRRRRSGSFVASPKSQESVLEIHDIKAEILASGKAYRHEVRSRQIRSATAEEARRLALGSNAKVLALVVRHFADGRPLVLENRLINLGAVPDAAAETFAVSPPGSWLLERIPWTEAEHVIRAVPADANMARQLGVPKGAACLLIERVTWQVDTTITHVRLVYPGASHRLIARFNPAGGMRAPRRLRPRASE